MSKNKMKLSTLSAEGLKVAVRVRKGPLNPVQKQECWVSKFGVVAYNTKYEQEFQELACGMQALLTKFEPRMSPRDLYDVAHQAAITAAGWLVAARALENHNKRVLKKHKNKR